MTYCGRFAPSPTGDLHLGSLVAAVGSWLCARHAHGIWRVRMDDLDPPREVPGAAAGILALLPRLGLVADGPVLYQSTRLPAYREAFEQLRDADRIFPCWCSRARVAGRGGVHRDGMCIAADDHRRGPAWRMRVPDLAIEFDDRLQGPQRVNLREHSGDFVVRRADGLFAYQLACAVDDHAQAVTEVVRGSDLLDSTPRQIWLQRCLGIPSPAYLHLPLVLDPGGNKLSKSSAAPAAVGEDPLGSLAWALRFLGMEVHADSARRMLDGALEQFRPALLPHCSGPVGT